MDFRLIGIYFMYMGNQIQDGSTHGEYSGGLLNVKNKRWKNVDGCLHEQQFLTWNTECLYNT